MCSQLDTRIHGKHFNSKKFDASIHKFSITIEEFKWSHLTCFTFLPWVSVSSHVIAYTSHWVGHLSWVNYEMTKMKRVFLC